MATHGLIEKITTEQLFLQKLPMATQRAFLYCTELQIFQRDPWYLAGGTALALQVGHRQSVDLDFFIPLAQFSERAIEGELLATGHWKTTLLERGTIFGLLKNAKMSLITYPFFIPSSRELRCGTARILVQSDIASMKIVAISQRGRKRDFVDLYWYCKNCEPLRDVIERAVQQYPGQEHNVNHILRSLMYFADAEGDPMPRIFFKANWNGIKQYFKKEVPIISRQILGLK